jgi:hypothetical protein
MFKSIAFPSLGFQRSDKMNFSFQIYAWLDSLVDNYPEVVTPIAVGRTYEGRQIRGVKLSFREGNRGVVLEGGATEIRLTFTYADRSGRAV